MNWTQLLTWVNDSGRTEAELKEVITALGLTAPQAGSPLENFRLPLSLHIETRLDLEAAVPAAAVPTGWVPPTTPPPAPVQPTTDAPTPPPASHTRLLLVAGLAATVGIIAAIVLFATVSGGNGDSTSTANGQTAMSSTPDGDGAKTTTQQTATPTTTGATVPNPFAQGSGGACQLDKIGTWSEGNNPYRIEVGGHGGQHLDFYPQYQPTRIYAISYIVDKIANPDGVPDIAWGYGSIWEGDTPECADDPNDNNCETLGSWDWTCDATGYARARLDSGHSGLVIDLRTNPPTVVANLRNLSQSDIMSLLAIHSAAMRKDEQGFEIPIPQMAVAPSTQQPVSEPAAAASVNCDTATVQETHVPVVGQGWTPAGEWRVVNFWTNEPGQPQEEHKILLSPGDDTALMGGGTSWSWPSACEDTARKAYDQSSLPAR